MAMLLKQSMKGMFLKSLSLSKKVQCFKLSKAFSTKSTVTSSFHRSMQSHGQFKLDQASPMDDCEELNELKKYFQEFEKEEESNDEFQFDEESGLTQMEMNEGGESDFSEELEKAIHGSEKSDSREHSRGTSKSKTSLKDIVEAKSQMKQGSKKSKEHLIDVDDADKRGMMYLRKNKPDQPTYLEKKFGLSISSDVRERQSDLQQFVLKSLQMLSIKEIQHFIQIIEYFKSKLTNQSFKKSQNVHEDFFMKQIFKLFQNNNAEELMELFLKCDLIDLNLNLFLNNVADYEKTYEIKSKFRQFDAFSKQSQPHGGHFLLNELAEKYNNLEYQRYSSLEDDIIEDQFDEPENKDMSQGHNSKTNKLADNFSNIHSNSANEQSLEARRDTDNSMISKGEYQKERLLFSKVARYEDLQHHHHHSNKNTYDYQLYQHQTSSRQDPRVSESLMDSLRKQRHTPNNNMNTNSSLETANNGQPDSSSSFPENSQSLSTNNDQQFSKEDPNGGFYKAESNSNDSWSSSLLEDDLFFEGTSKINNSTSLGSNQKNNSSSIIQNEHSSNGSNEFIDNFILEPSKLSQQKITQVRKQFENQFHLNIIDDFTSSSSSNSKLRQNSSSSGLLLENNTPMSNNSIKLLEKDVSELWNLESERSAISTKKINKIHNNKMVLKANYERDVQSSDEVIILKQEEPLVPKKHEITNWVYLFKLPYNLNEVQNYPQFVKNFVESCFGEIEEAHFFNYMDFFEIEKTVQKTNSTLTPEQEIKLRGQLQEQFLQQNQLPKKTIIAQTITPENPAPTVINTVNTKNKTSTASSGSQLNLKNLSDEELLQKIYINSKINPDFCQKALRRTERILENLETKKEQKYNRSYAMLKFKSKESKDKCLSADIRLFGIQNINQTFYTDDADYKKSLIITKIPWGVNLQYLITKLNDQLKFHGLKHIKISLENVNLKKVVTKYFLLVKFNSFEDTLEVMKAFKENDFMIETSKLSCNHCYGSLKLGPKGFYEVTDMVMGKDINLLERVNERKVFEIWNIYKEKSGYLGNRDIESEENGLINGSNHSNFELKEEELEDYNEVEQDVVAQKITAGNNEKINHNHVNSAFGQGFSKSSVFSQMKSIHAQAKVTQDNGLAEGNKDREDKEGMLEQEEEQDSLDYEAQEMRFEDEEEQRNRPKQD